MSARRPAHAPTAAAATPQRVDQVLARSRARAERRSSLGDGLELVQWHNAHDHTSYLQPGHHTLSVYLEGGWQTQARGLQGSHGSPGCHCLLPAEHESHWDIGAPQRFVHLYWSGSAWADRVVRLLDAEPRSFSLQTRIFAQDEALAGWAQQIAALDWQDPLQRMQAQAISHQALDRLLLQAATPAQRSAALRPKGGLGSAVRRELLAYIDAHLDAPTEALSLATLAARAHLSEFHFARMFRVSMGCSVQGWISQLRLQRARELLLQADGPPLGEVARRCGYASASHLNRQVRRAFALTPGQLRAAAQR
ncbi:AraC family transcriptional regulator [Paucibacter sp. APW11]|uniref:AraC family transcriptional regulator n=1 Tax=Roseateles aquae TaxID=3077235 RepID=A0ABU3PGH8_9BURK|nr:AraC family transcriptional regulator [Paucibacter sp. APW11]MDT9001644.1 AraC family transcriptional regulator [Paucibacter sp. APW11]